LSTNEYSCTSCGSKVEFDVRSQDLKCPNCGTVYPIEKELAHTKHLISDYVSDENAMTKHEATVIVCSSCGASIELDTHVTSGACPYCASPVVLSEKAVTSIEPDGICPFKIDQHDAVSLFRKWIKGKWLAPNALKNMYQSGKIMGVYLPYWIFDADADCKYQAEGGKDRRVEYTENGEKKTRTETDWYSVKGTIFHSFKDKIVRATKSISDRLLRILGGFNVKSALSFHANFFTGFSSEIFNIPIHDAYKEAQDHFQNVLRGMVESKVRLTYDRVRNVRLWVTWSKEYYRFMFLPVYTMAYYFNGKTYQVLINGDSGQIVGDYPKSFWKIFFVVLAILIVLGLLYYFFG
jgi:DNA-directed RNA polymerase subunit RPC12/RpoP